MDDLTQVFTSRQIQEYSSEEHNIIRLFKERFRIDVEILRSNKKCMIYENQNMIALDVIRLLANRKIINIMVISKTQSGKTGSMCAIIKHYLDISDNIIPIENIYIITGVSSVEWKNQTKERMPDCIQSRVFHRGDLPRSFINDIINKRNVLIIIDETHIAAKKNQSLHKMFIDAGFLDKNQLYAKDVKIIEFSATPDGTLYDLTKWNDASDVIFSNGGNGYVSAYDFLHQGRIKQYKNLYDDVDAMHNICEIKTDILQYTEPLYHIIRTIGGQTKNGVNIQDAIVQNFKRVFNEDNSYEFKYYDEQRKIDTIDRIMSVPPTKHTFIFIKEMWRCSKTLKKDYIGILYERHTQNPNDSTIIQGLVGRMTGYDDNKKSICYTNINSIVKYEQLWESKFKDKSIIWNSSTTKIKDECTTSVNTFNHTSNFNGFSSKDTDNETNDNDEPEIKKFNTFEEAKLYFLNVVRYELNKPNAIGPTMRGRKQVNGFYLSASNSETRVRSTNEIYKIRKYAFSKKTDDTNHKFVVHPCYRDVNDANTLEWWLIYYM
jgi:hypothetical protein